MNVRLTLLQRMEVERDGRAKLGRLMDVRARARLGPIARAESLDAESLLLGASGWLEQMGLRQGGAREAPARSIVGIEREKIIVRAMAATRDARSGRKGG
jgi:hypothetical protein